MSPNAIKKPSTQWVVLAFLYIKYYFNLPGVLGSRAAEVILGKEKSTSECHIPVIDFVVRSYCILLYFILGYFGGREFR